MKQQGDIGTRCDRQGDRYKDPKAERASEARQQQVRDRGRDMKSAQVDGGPPPQVRSLDVIVVATGSDYRNKEV